MKSKEFPFTIQLSAVNSIDPTTGVLRGVTVAEIGIATGHFAYLDRDNKVLGVGGIADAGNFTGFAKRVPLCMDAASLDTVVAAGQAANRVKAREDHDDSVGARAGFASTFRLEDGKAVCDLAVFDAYRNRGVFMETAEETPELIGLSGDFKFTADVRGDQAFMRVVKIDAVDIVDKGALTHAGLFRAGKVDTPENRNPKLSIMAKSNTGTEDEMAAPDLAAFKTMCDSIASYSAKHADFATGLKDCMASIMPVVVPTPEGAPAPVKKPASNPDAEVPGSGPAAAFAAMKTELVTELRATFAAQVDASVKTAVNAAKVEFQQQMGALGIKPNAAPAPAADSTKEPVKEQAGDFLTMRAAIAKEKNITLTQAARIVMREHTGVYHAYQVKLGILKA